MEKIRYEARRAFGSGLQATAFEIGAQWMQTQLPSINDLARQSYNTAFLRGKTGKKPNHMATFYSILDELKEFRNAGTIKSEHIPEYSEQAEELTDILICCLTELHSLGVNVEEILKAKIEFNKTRV